MIFVSLGTQKQSMKRLLEYLEHLKLKETIIVQNGNTTFTSASMQLVGFLTYDEMEAYIKAADVVICHGGGGTIFQALHQQKKVICVPRLKKYHEHINDHQVEMIDTLVKKGYLLECRTEEELKDALQGIKNYHPTPYAPNRIRFVKEMQQQIDQLLQ